MEALKFEAVLLVALSLHLCASSAVNSGDSARWSTTPTDNDFLPPAGWNFPFGAIDWQDSAGWATFKPVSALCKNPGTFADGNDVDARHMIIQAFVQNQDSSIVYAGGTKDGGAFASMFDQSWYNASKIHIHASEASGSVAHFAAERVRNHPEVTIRHIALSDVDSHSFVTVGGFGPLSSNGVTWNESRTVSTKRMSTVFREFTQEGASGMQDHFDYVWINAEGASETRAILGMGLPSGDPNGIIQGLADRFPLIQFELGKNWLDFSPVDYSQDRQSEQPKMWSGSINSGSWSDDAIGITTQQDMIRHFESIGYAVFLMGKDQDLPLLIRVHEEFLHQASCVQDPGGKGFFLPGHALAIHWTVYIPTATDYVTHIPEEVRGAITAMVLRGQNYILTMYGGGLPTGGAPASARGGSSRSTLAPSFVVSLFGVAIIQALLPNFS